jgi:hypothetical protein
MRRQLWILRYQTRQRLNFKEIKAIILLIILQDLCNFLFVFPIIKKVLGIFNELLLHLINYFEEMWIGRPNRRNIRRPPIFDLKLLNQYDTIHKRICQKQTIVLKVGI